MGVLFFGIILGMRGRKIFGGILGGEIFLGLDILSTMQKVSSAMQKVSIDKFLGICFSYFYEHL